VDQGLVLVGVGALALRKSRTDTTTLALVFAAGYLLGSQYKTGASAVGNDKLKSEANEVLDSVGRLAQTGALKDIADLKIKNGSADNGVVVEITTTKKT
jgi:hypothetical protein